MARKKLTRRQMTLLLVLWTVLVIYILIFGKVTGLTIIYIILSGAFVFIPIYKDMKNR